MFLLLVRYGLTTGYAHRLGLRLRLRTQRKENFLSDIELPKGIVPAGGLHGAIVRLDIPSCGKATIWEHEGVRYIRHSGECSLDERQKRHDAYKREVNRLARKHGVKVDRNDLEVTIDRLRKKPDVHLSEAHSCQTGVLVLGPHPFSQRRAMDGPDARPPWIIEAEKRLTKHPYSLLFSFLYLVSEPKQGNTLEDWVPSDKVLGWCTMYGLPDTEESHTDEPYGCLQLNRFQRESVVLYLLFQLWRALIAWRDFEAESGPRDPQDVKRHRDAIHRYADLLLRCFTGGDRHYLRVLIHREHLLKQQLDRGIVFYVDPRNKQEFNLKKEHTEAKASVDGAASCLIDEVMEQQRHVDRLSSVVTSTVAQVARSVFDACYVQLGQRMQQPRGEVARHLKLCAVEGCGHRFWARHGNQDICDEHPSKGARWAAKNRQRKRRSAITL
jgi:hypothetical protein